MKRVLLSLGLVGIVFAGYTPDPIHTRDAAPAAPKHRAVPQAANRAGDGAWDRPNVRRLAIQPVALSPQTGAAQQPDGLPEAEVKDIFTPALAPVLNREETSEQSQANALWVLVTRGAWMHKGPSVSTPIIGHYSPNSELQMVGSERGWFQVLDPTTGEQGWILARYYLEPIDAPGQKRVAVRTEQVPVAAASKALEPRRPALQRKRYVQASRLAPPDNPQPRAVPVRRSGGEGVESILARALQR